MSTSIHESTAKALGGKAKTPKKEVSDIRTRKGASGGFIHTHRHTAPEHHPDEEHVSKDQDAMVSHMLQHLGTPNPGEADADAGQSGIPDPAAAQGAPAGGAPTSGAPAPTPGAAAAGPAGPVAGM